MRAGASLYDEPNPSHDCTRKSGSDLASPCIGWWTTGFIDRSRLMRKFIMPALAATAAIGMFAATPADAQRWQFRPAARVQLNQDINQLDRRIVRAERRHTITRREALTLRSQTARLRSLYYRYNRNGLTRGEVQVLESRVNRIRANLRLSRRTWM